MTMVTVNGRAYWGGVLVALGLIMAQQDWLGMEAYIQHVRANWVTLPWWVGALIALSGVILATERKTDENGRK